MDPTQNNVYLITNNKWNWFVYQGLEFTATKQSSKLQLISTYTLACSSSHRRHLAARRPGLIPSTRDFRQ